MEGAADAGEIVISDATAAALSAGLVGRPKGAGHLLRRAPSLPRSSPFSPSSGSTQLSISDRASRSGSGRRSSRGPSRSTARSRWPSSTSTGLIGSSPKQGPDEAARQLDVLVTHVQGAADRQGVTFLATDADRDGGKIILTAGAPSSSGDDEHRMLLAVREIMDAENPLPIRIGVNQGSVFVGEVGPHYRRTFTVMGDAVNLAARLMAKAAPGEILTTPDLLARVGDRLRCDGARTVPGEGQGQAGAGGAPRRQDEGSGRAPSTTSCPSSAAGVSCTSSMRSRNRHWPAAAPWWRSSA